MTEKKASDLILEINEKTDQILSFVKNIDFQYKLILNRLNSKSEMPKQDVPTSIENTLPEPKISFVEEKKLPNVSDKKITVRQKVLYPNPINLPVLLANVKIYNDKKELINEKLKTDPQGYWTAKLEVGKYFVHITKAAVGKKPIIDHYIEFDILSTDEILELNIAQ